MYQLVYNNQLDRYCRWFRYGKSINRYELAGNVSSECGLHLTAIESFLY